MTKKQISLSSLIFMSLCCVMGLFAKRLISPCTNLLTDLIRLPGGGTSAGITLAFLVLGASFSQFKAAGTLIGFVQGLLALFLGMAGHQGALAPLTYAVPGIVVDLIRLLPFPSMAKPDFYVASCSLAAGANALSSSLLVFHFKGFVLLLWCMLAVCAGILGGFISYLTGKQLRRIIAER